MRFTAQIRVWLAGTTVLREPTFWESLTTALGAHPDLSTDVLRCTRDVLALAEGMQRALAQAGVTNAISLVVDDRVLYHDPAGLPDDAPWLVQAVRTNAAALQGGFEVLRMVFEHAEGGDHMVIEATFRARYGVTEPAALLAFGGRIDALRPEPGEATAVTRARVEALLSDPARAAAHRQRFDDVVGRVRDGLLAAFPDGRLDAGEVLAQMVRPSRAAVQAVARRPLTLPAVVLRQQPWFPHRGAYGRYYDPWATYYDDPLYAWSELQSLDALLFGQQRYDMPVYVVDERGAPICEADAIPQDGAAFAGLHDVAGLDFATTGPTPEPLACYGKDDARSGWAGTAGAYTANDPAEDWSGAADLASSTSAGATDCSWSSDCATSDCAKDCSSDCTSSDCSKDCSSDCASSDCASSDCSKDCSSDCATSDCSKDCSSDCSSW